MNQKKEETKVFLILAVITIVLGFITIQGLEDNNITGAFIKGGKTIPPEEIKGCMDSEATNYNPNATIEDFCEYPEEIKGCTDPEATNYNPEATFNDGCEYPAKEEEVTPEPEEETPPPEIIEEDTEEYPEEEEEEIVEVLEEEIPLINLPLSSEEKPVSITAISKLTQIDDSAKLSLIIENKKSWPITLTSRIEEKETPLENEARIRELLKEDETKITSLRLIEQEKVQPVLFRKFYHFFPSTLTFTGERTSANLLKSKISRGQEITVPPGRQEIEIEIDTGISLGKEVDLIVIAEGEFLRQNLKLQNTGAKVAFDLRAQENFYDLYFSFPEAGQYFVEIDFVKDEKRVYYELLGPYNINQGRIFSQEFQYDPLVYSGIHEVTAKIYKNRKVISQEEFKFDFD